MRMFKPLAHAAVLASAIAAALIAGSGGTALAGCGTIPGYPTSR